MSNKDRYDLHLRALVKELSRSIVEATDEEIKEDARLAGVDLDVNAAQMKERFTDIAKSFHQRKFVQAQEAYKVEVQNLQRRSFQLPASVAEQRALLHLVATQQAATGASFTAKFRDFDNLSDSDVASLLEELAALGVLPDPGPKG